MRQATWLDSCHTCPRSNENTAVRPLSTLISLGTFVGTQSPLAAVFGSRKTAAFEQYLQQALLG